MSAFFVASLFQTCCLATPVGATLRNNPSREIMRTLHGRWLNQAKSALLRAAAISLMFPLVAAAQTPTQHFRFTNNTGENYSILVRSATLNGVPLITGDEIGVFTPAGLCVGAVAVSSNLGFSAWQDDSQTPAVDGYIPGESMSFRFWHNATQTELNAAANYRLGNGTFDFGPYADVELSVAFNFAPQISSQLDTIRFDEDTSFDLNLDVNVNDPNDAVALLNWQVECGPNLTATITSQRVLQLTPKPDWFGVENCTLIVADPAGAGDTANVKIVVNNLQDRPTAPVLLDPIAGVAIRSLNPVLRWRAATDVDGDKLFYTIVYSTSPTLAALNDTLGTDLTAVRVQKFLTRDTRYYWRATASDGQTAPVASGIESFVVANDAVSVAQGGQTPLDFVLEQNYPNPFSPVLPAAATQIRFTLPLPARISVRIYNALGQSVRALFDGAKSAGVHQLLWDGRNDHGLRVSTGLYWLRLESENFVATKKMVVTP